MALIAFDVFAFSTSEAMLGGRRIVGHSELAGNRELIARGLYARVRHPRYLGMMAGVLGACLIVASGPLWAASVVWLFLALLTIRAEERELRARLGPGLCRLCRACSRAAAIPAEAARRAGFLAARAVALDRVSGKTSRGVPGRARRLQRRGRRQAPRRAKSRRSRGPPSRPCLPPSLMAPPTSCLPRSKTAWPARSIAATTCCWKASSASSRK